MRERSATDTRASTQARDGRGEEHQRQGNAARALRVTERVSESLRRVRSAHGVRPRQVQHTLRLLAHQVTECPPPDPFSTTTLLHRHDARLRHCTVHVPRDAFPWPFRVVACGIELVWAKDSKGRRALCLRVRWVPRCVSHAEEDVDEGAKEEPLLRKLTLAVQTHHTPPPSLISA
eukprot:735807-Rhodomonas_salina.1